LLEGGQPYIYNWDFAFDYVQDELLPKYKKEIDNAVKVEGGLKKFTIENSLEAQYGESTDIFMVYETHPLFNYPLIDEKMAHEDISDKVMSELSLAVTDYLTQRNSDRIRV
jgi:hypothetical protein